MTVEATTPVWTIQDLDRPEHLLVWALRTIAVGQANCPLLDKTFAAACGPVGPEALAAYFLLVRSISASGRRRMRVHAPGCACVSLDEIAVVGVVAAAQASIRDADETLLKMRLGFLVDATASEAIVFSAQALGRILERSGHVLPLRLHPAAKSGFVPTQVNTLH